MKTLEESVVDSMDGKNKELFPFLPYILQDIWEFGADPEAIIRLIRKHFQQYTHLKILDLGCGKGPVSVKIAKELGCSCHGIDALPEFIQAANQKATEFGVEQLCTFETGDIRSRIKLLSGYDIVVIGAIGPVFGDFYSTLTTLARILNKKGILIIDDGYIEDTSSFNHPLILKHADLLQQTDRAGMEIFDEEIIQNEDIRESDYYLFRHISERCNELIQKYPDKKEIFLDYIEKQREENEILENRVVCSTMVVKRKNFT